MKNPVFWLELTTRMRERRTWIVTMLFLICLGGISAVVMAASLLPRGSDLARSPADCAASAFWATFLTWQGLLLLVAAQGGAARISAEREQRTLQTLLNTPLSRPGIVLGKLGGTWLLVLWTGSLALPFLATTLVWGGVDLRWLAVALATAIASALVVASLSVGLSGFFARSITSHLAIAGVLFLWIVVWPVFGSLANLYTPEDPDTARIFSRAVTLVFVSHNPVFMSWWPAVKASAADFGGGGMGDDWPLAFVTGWIVWATIGLGGFSLALRSLRRGASRRA